MIAQDQLIGSRFEKCVVERLIGRGGYGLTFLAFDEELQEHRVIKVSQDAGLDEASRKRHLKTFLDEGLILSRLKHPQIVTLRGQGDRHGHRYMILDYIQGYSLRTVLDIVGQRQAELGCAWKDLIDPATATAMVLSSLYPLEYAHRANVHLPDREIFGVAHRDISPGNLILGVKGNEKGRLVLIDFGTAKTALTENVTLDQNLVGTIPYMGKARLQKANSPEQKAQYQDFWRDFRETQHDIHALGVLYYQLLTGRLPFYGETSPQIIVKILDPEAYSRCHLEIASAHSFASGVLRKCLVYPDFSLSQNEQPYQYPDAAAMLPDMEEVFHGLADGRTVNDVLIALGKKLAHPESMQAAAGDKQAAVFESGKMPALANTAGFARNLPFPPRRRPAVHYLSAGALALALGAGWWLASQSRRDGNPAQEHPAQGGAGIGVNPGHAEGTRADGKPEGSSEFLEKLDGGNSSSGATGKSRARTPGNQARRKEASGESPGGGSPSGESPSEASPGPGGASEAHAGDPSPPENLAQTAEGAYRLGVDAGLPWGKEAFVQLQTLVREEDPTAFDRISVLLEKNPESPDLGLLKCQLILARNPASAESRRELAVLQEARPEYMHPGLFTEQTLYLLWKTDAAIYQSQKTPANRIRLLKSANTYISEYAPHSAYKEKVKRIQAGLPD